MYCNFQETGQVFKHKKIYKCSECGLTIALENPDAKIICFPYAREIFNHHIVENDGHPLNKDMIVNNKQEAHILIDKIKDNDNIISSTKPLNVNKQKESDQDTTLLCTQEQIESRLAICKKCEYYKDDACLLCGCTIVREKNYKNKLANVYAHCPDGRWGPTKT